MLSPACEHRRLGKTRVRHTYLIQVVTFLLPNYVRSDFHIEALSERNVPRCLCFWCDDVSGQAVTQGNDLNTEKGLKWLGCAGAWLKKSPKKGNAQAVSTGRDDINPMLKAEAESLSDPKGQMFRRNTLYSSSPANIFHFPKRPLHIFFIIFL